VSVRFPLPPALALAAALALLASPAHAQRPAGPPGGPAGTVTGVIVDAETGETLPSATAAVYAAADSSFVTGAAADLDGAFRVEAVPAGTYQVRVSFLGYTTRRLRGVAVAAGQTVDLGRVALAADAALLEGAEVVGQRELVEQRADRTVYNVADQAVTAGGSALETLATLPAIEVDTDGAVSLRGNQNVVVQINGRPVPVRGSQLAALLRQIPANRVQRVEVLPNPSARFDADGMSGIVNIVLVEGTDRGLSGGFTLGGGTQPTGEAGANVAYQAGPWDVYGSYGYRYDGFEALAETDRTLSGPILSINADEAMGRDGQSHFGTLSATYDLTASQSLQFEGSAGLRSGANENRIEYLNTPTVGAPYESFRLTDGDGSGVNLDGALVYRRSFSTAAPTAGGAPRSGGGGGGMGMGGMGGGPRGGGGSAGGGARGEHELALEARVSRNADDDLSLFTEALADPAAVPDLTRTDTDGETTEYIGQADYARPVGGVRLETGAKAIVRAVGSDVLFEDQVGGVFVPDAARTNAFTYDEGVYAAYVQGAREFGSLAVQAGLRAEAATREFTLSTTPPVFPGAPPVDLTDTSFEYQSLFPSAFATYTFAPGSLVKASYSRRIERPRARRLSPFPTFEDTLSVRVGNPQLRPEYTDAYELTFQALYFLNISPFYRHTTDVVRDRIFFDPATGVTTQTSQNLDTQDSYGADVTLLGQAFGGRLRGFLSGTAARVVTDGGSEQTGVGVDAMSYSARANLQIKVRQGTDVQLFGFYRAPQETEDGRVSGFGLATLGLSQRITPALQLSARVNDIFSTSRFSFESTRAGGTILGVRDPQIQQVSATLTYSFGAGQPRPQRQPQDQQGTEGGFGL
jgi:outer membrane receptor protein involved in Fe transport